MYVVLLQNAQLVGGFRVLTSPWDPRLWPFSLLSSQSKWEKSQVVDPGLPPLSILSGSFAVALSQGPALQHTGANFPPKASVFLHLSTSLALNPSSPAAQHSANDWWELCGATPAHATLADSEACDLRRSLGWGIKPLCQLPTAHGGKCLEGTLFLGWLSSLPYCPLTCRHFLGSYSQIIPVGITTYLLSQSYLKLLLLKKPQVRLHEHAGLDC